MEKLKHTFIMTIKETMVKNDENIKINFRTFLEVQWLRHHAPNAGAQVPSVVGELRSHMPHGAAKKYIIIIIMIK